MLFRTALSLAGLVSRALTSPLIELEAPEASPSTSVVVENTEIRSNSDHVYDLAKRDKYSDAFGDVTNFTIDDPSIFPDLIIDVLFYNNATCPETLWSNYSFVDGHTANATYRQIQDDILDNWGIREASTGRAIIKNNLKVLGQELIDMGNELLKMINVTDDVINPSDTNYATERDELRRKILMYGEGSSQRPNPRVRYTFLAVGYSITGGVAYGTFEIRDQVSSNLHVENIFSAASVIVAAVGVAITNAVAREIDFGQVTLLQALGQGMRQFGLGARYGLESTRSLALQGASSTARLTSNRITTTLQAINAGVRAFLGGYRPNIVDAGITNPPIPGLLAPGDIEMAVMSATCRGSPPPPGSTSLP